MNQTQHLWVQTRGTGDLPRHIYIDLFEVLFVLDLSTRSAHVDDHIRVGHDSLYHLEIIEIHVSDDPTLTQIGTQLQLLHLIAVVEPRL